MRRSITDRREVVLEPALVFLREIWALNHALESTSKRMHDRMGITAQQRMVLRFVGKHPNISGGELASLLHVEKSTLSLALKRLLDAGLVTRRRDPSDARKSRIALTARGRRLDVPTVGTVERAVERALEASSANGAKTVRRFLQRLVELLESESESESEPVSSRR